MTAPPGNVASTATCHMAMRNVRDRQSMGPDFYRDSAPGNARAALTGLRVTVRFGH